MGKLSQKPGHYLERDRFATRAETMERLFRQWEFVPTAETVPLSQAAGRVSAENLFSRNQLPVCRGAAADGVAVRFSDFEEGPPDFSNWKENVDYAPADMGDDFDDSFDTVLWIEEFTFDENGKIVDIKPEEPVKKGQLVRQKGSTLEIGEVVLNAGDVITPFRLGVLAAAGIETVRVIRQPRIAYLPTGSELIPAGQTPARGQNIESNSLMVAAFGARWGAQVACLPIVEDQKSQLEKALDNALGQGDMVLINGGTSMGTEDYTSSLLEKRSSYFQHGVRCIPGIPVAVAVVNGKPVVNLPGPPYAAFCALDWCARALVYHWYGLPLPERKKVKAVLDRTIQKPPVHEMYIQIVLQKSEEGAYRATPLPMEVRYAEGAKQWNALFIASIGRGEWEAGCEIEVELL